MNQAASGAQSRLIEIRAATAALMAEYRRYQNYAALQSAYGQMIASIGIDPLPATVTGHDVKTLSQAIRSFQWHPVTSTSPGPAPVPVEKKL